MNLDQITWDGRNWKKKVKGKQYYLGNDPTPAGRKAAVELLKKKVAEADSSQQDFNRMVAAFKNRAEQLQSTEDLLETKNPNFVKLADSSIDSILFNPANTIGNSISSFLTAKKNQKKNGRSLSLGRLNNLKIYLDQLKEYANPENQVSTMDADFCEGYYNHLSELDFSSDYKTDLFATFKSFVEYLWQKDKIAYPKILKSETLTFGKTLHEIETIPLDDLKKLALCSSSKTKLYFYLALNCSMTQIDIATLKPEMVKAGKLTRKRTKTKHHATVPTVTYPLWPITKQLLEQHGNRVGELLVTDDSGKPLIKETNNGKYQKLDNIMSAFQRVCRKLGMNYSFGKLRKTAASMIDPSFSELFLGHSPKTTASKYYVKTPAEFEKAVMKLGKDLSVLEEIDLNLLPDN